MQSELKEGEYFKERTEGYRESVQSDIERKDREKKEEDERLEKEKAEEERKEAIEKRRKELKESLPEEDTSGKAKKIAIRFADGRKGQRRFAPTEPLSAVLNWVDAIYEVDREKVVLTSMNGKQTMFWDDETNDKTLHEAGFGKNTGFRVAEKEEKEDADDSKEKSEEDSSQ
jgi:hypothetical protein